MSGAGTPNELENVETSSEYLGRHIIQPGAHLLIRLPSKEVRQVRLDKEPGDKTLNFGKFGSLKQKFLIGKPFSLTYEIQQDKSLVVQPPPRLEELEDTGATNEQIVDRGEFVQPLTAAEIELLKKSGLHASEIIKRQIEMHANYELKTEYSKDKYRKRKEAKFAKQITVLQPSLFNVVSYLFDKDPVKIQYLRVDTLGQIANLANLRPGGRFIVVDSIGGLLVATALERLGGEGMVLYITEADSPPQFQTIDLLNMPEEHTSILKYLNWAAIDEEHEPIRAPIEPEGEFRSEGQRERYGKRKQMLEAHEKLREELFNGEWDGLLIASQYEPFSIVQRFTPYLAGSASITIYSQYLPILTEAQSKMRPMPVYLSPSITEAWLRQYQVLPGRTHPLMNMSGSGGYILHAIRVYDDEKALSALTGFRQRLKQRRIAKDAARSAEGGEQGVASEDIDMEDTESTS